MNDWKDLEIGNIPSDFFVNDRYEVQHLIERWYEDGSDKWCECQSGIKGKANAIFYLVDGHRYRYRLKPLEPIRITNKEADILAMYYTNYKGEPTDSTPYDLEKNLADQWR